MSQSQILRDAIGMPLKHAGFKQKSDSWYMANNETISVVNLQKSAYGEQYYVNVGLWLKDLGDAETPKEHHCHIRCRWKSLIQEDEKYLERLLDLDDTSFSDDERSAKIGHFVEMNVVPFLQKCASLEGLRSLYKSSVWPKASLIHRNARELLGAGGT